tara:strand:+ start:433 stop:1161 length:729 start_codon:yes stop_codon:yes gene_type:complete
MAEEDIALATIRTKAEGIEIIDVVDAKYEKLGKTFAKGEKRAEGTEQALKDLQKQLDKNSKSTADASVKNIESLMIMEAATSGINQLISARYKEIDSQLASGKITQEEAEQLRKNVKQQEKYSSTLEKSIAIMRLYKVAQFMMAAAQSAFTAATVGGTAAVKLNTKALLANPVIRFVVIWLSLTAALVAVNREFGFLQKQLDAVEEKLRPITNSIDRLIEGIETVTGFDIQNNRLFGALLTE